MGRQRAVEIILVGVGLEHALLGEVVLDAGLGPDLGHAGQALEGQLQVGERTGAVQGGGAVAQETQAPAPHVRQRLQAEQHGRVDLAEPAQDLARHAGCRPGLDRARVDDPAIAPAGLEPGRLAALDHLDLVAVAGEEPGAGRPDHAGAEDEDPHCSFPRPGPEPGDPGHSSLIARRQYRRERPPCSSGVAGSAANEVAAAGHGRRAGEVRRRGPPAPGYARAAAAGTSRDRR